jgi:hypothetical protein
MADRRPRLLATPEMAGRGIHHQFFVIGVREWTMLTDFSRRVNTILHYDSHEHPLTCPRVAKNVGVVISPSFQ